jgi:general secretion pathway protein A
VAAVFEVDANVAELVVPVLTAEVVADVFGAQRVLALGHELSWVCTQARVELEAHLVLDEAHLLGSVHTFETLRLLLNFESGGTPSLTLLLVAEPAILPALDRMPQWEERLGVKCLLSPFSESETAAYVEHRLRAAGASRTIIEPEALPTLYALTGGVARRINRLCDLALLIGFAEERATIDAEHFEAVCRELVAVAP